MGDQDLHMTDGAHPNMPRTASQIPPAKRQRVLIACDACRQRKSKCDGVKPICAMCTATGTNCRYAKSSLSDSDGTSVRHVKVINERLRTLEEMVMSSNIPTLFQQTASSVAQIRNPSAGVSAPHTDLSQSRPVTHVDTHTSTIAAFNDSYRLAHASDATDGMGAMCSEPNQQTCFYGPSSNIILIRLISRMLERHSGAPDAWGVSIDPGENSCAWVNKLHVPESDHDISANKPQKVGEAFDEHAIPPDPVVQGLLNQFFSHMGVLWPILHKPTFVAEYSRLRTLGARHIRRSWLALFNIVLALATMTIVHDEASPDCRAAEAQVYYHRAITLCDRSTIVKSSLEIVQVLLLTVEYLQATNKAMQTSVHYSLAVNAAIRIGLHSPSANQMYPPLECEMRQRTWHLLVIFDRVLGMTMGQPLIISSNLVGNGRFRELDEVQSGSRPSDQSEIQSLDIFTISFELYKILGKCIDQLYNQNIDMEEVPDLLGSIANIWDLDNELQKWHRELPKDYKILTSSEFGMIFDSIDLAAQVLLNRRFQIILTLRYLNLRVLMHRPVLSRFFESTYSLPLNVHDANLLSKLGSRSLSTCFQCSMEIITIVSRIAGESKPALRYLGTWWFTLYYTFNAALIVLGIMVACHDTGRKLPHGPARATCQEGIHRAIQALSQLDPGNTIIQRCHDYLLRLLAVSNMFAHSGVVTRNTDQVSVTDKSSRLANSLETFTAQPASTLTGQFYGDINTGSLVSDDDFGFLDSYVHLPDSTGYQPVN